MSYIFTETSNEGTLFAVALSPSYYSKYDAELIIINARHTTEATITTSRTSDVVTVYGNWSLHYDFDYIKRTTTDIEEKGKPHDNLQSFITTRQHSCAKISLSFDNPNYVNYL